MYRAMGDMRIKNNAVDDPPAPLTFTFDGVEYVGRTGDTVASALLANGVRLMGRSFKYHRPRGVMTAGSHEPNALISVVRGGDVTPNVRATCQALYQGLDCTSQNRFPSLKYDFMGLNGLLSPFLGAGFYYKTFMWPKAFWEKIYEPVIRRAAGLGALSGKSDRQLHVKAFAFCDVLIIGGGPSGIAAALTAANAGADVIVADEALALGGQLRHEVEEIDGKPALDWIARQSAALKAMPNVRVMHKTRVTGVYDGGTYGALEQVGEHLAEPLTDVPETCFWRIVAKRAVLCAGAIERPIAFNGNDRPGVMMASAVRAYVNLHNVKPGQSAVVFCNNDDAHRTARDLLAAGVDMAAVVDSRSDAPQIDGVEMMRGATVVDTTGRLGLTSVTVQSGDGVKTKIDCDLLAVSGGWNPSIHLTCHLNGKPVWNPTINCFVARPGAVPGLDVAGAANGVFSTKMALKSGNFRCRTALKEMGFTTKPFRTPQADDSEYNCQPIWTSGSADGKALVDFQNDVTVKDIKQAVRENYTSVEHMKRYTTQGMATDQGKNSNVMALAILADATGQSIEATGTTTFRPPFTPIPIAALGAGGGGLRYAPQRKTAAHGFWQERNAPFIEAGLWYRASWFPQEGETHWRESCNREVGYVRNTVGVTDVSTLGKIDIQGPDAAEFLDRIYTNTFSTLKVGKARYGLMLREDGFVLDDGTTARLGETHFVMTTTTAAAGDVMLHLDFCAQVLWPELDVVFTSVTDHWAQFAVAGPKSAALLAQIVEGGFKAGDLPFMGCGEVSVGGVRGRLFRISFSGELAYEIAVPARFGDALARLLADKAQALGGGIYGIEALNVLRIEKGFITHAEIHGRVTAEDIGLAGMVSRKKDCIGKVMVGRSGMVAKDREQMVGLVPTGASKQLLSGAHLYNNEAATHRADGQGYVTSHCFSPTLGHGLALGFVKSGRARLGEEIVMIDHLREVKTKVRIVDPVFFDPDGGRARG
jgi:heterotetrameric sarcosine oxidase alpha subunit